jgi:hypothetical protein
MEEAYTKSEVCYWLKDGESEIKLIEAGAMVPPVVGEVIYIDTKMDKDWYDVHFKKAKFNLYEEGVCGDFEVFSVKRYLKKSFYRDKETGFLFSKTRENFEVFIKKFE